VAGREHDTEIGVTFFGQKRDPRGRQDAEPYDIHPGAGQTRDNGGLQELSGSAWITTDHGDGWVSMELAGLAQYPGGCDGQA
jgi:hypothetical protein